MTILTALQEVVDNFPGTPIKRLILADLNEANATIVDQLTNSEYPILLVMPYAPIDTPGSSGVLSTTVDLDLFFLTKSENITSEYSAAAIETECIAPMRLLAQRFWHRLNEHEIINAETNGIQARQHLPAYSSMDANLFGVESKATVPVRESADVCI